MKQNIHMQHRFQRKDAHAQNSKSPICSDASKTPTSVCVLGRNRSHDQQSLERKLPLNGEALSPKRVPLESRFFIHFRVVKNGSSWSIFFLAQDRSPAGKKSGKQKALRSRVWPSRALIPFFLLSQVVRGPFGSLSNWHSGASADTRTTREEKKKTNLEQNITCGHSCAVVASNQSITSRTQPLDLALASYAPSQSRDSVCAVAPKSTDLLRRSLS